MTNILITNYLCINRKLDALPSFNDNFFSSDVVLLKVRSKIEIGVYSFFHRDRTIGISASKLS